MKHVTHPLSSADISIFYQKSANFVISRNTVLDSILMQMTNFFKFSWVFKDFFSKPCYNFDNVNKNGYLRPS